MNDAMYLVAKGWYRVYYAVMIGFSTLVAIGCVLAKVVPAVGHFSGLFGLDLVAFIIASAQILYSLSAYWLVEKRNPAIALFGGSMIFALLLLHGMTVTDPGQGAWLYVGVWLVTAFLVDMYGAPTMLGSVLLGGIYVMLHYGFIFTGISQQSWVLLGANSLISLASYPFWKRQFVNAQSLALSQLSGALRSNQEQSAILIQSIADGVIVTNTEGKISLMNRVAANMTGWTVEEATGIDVQLVCKVAQEDGKEIGAEEYPFKTVLVHRAFINQVLQLTSRAGKKQVVSLVVSPVVTRSGEVYGAVAVMRDISQERAAEHQRGEFISTASHEMRTPVAAIEGYLALALNDKVSTIDSRARGYLEKAHSSTQHLGQLFQDLLTSAKAEDGRLSNHPAVVEMGAFLEQLVEDLRFGAQKKGLSTEFTVGSNEAIDATKEDAGSSKVVRPLYYVYVDPDRVREVITNIFDNAVKYTDQGKVSIGLTGNGDVVQLYVRDTGNGIPAEDIPHLFQKFYRVDSSATRTTSGTGLGLFIARKIIELYQGRIWVESELGKGSTFFINLPRLDSQKAQQLVDAANAAPPPPVKA